MSELTQAMPRELERFHDWLEGVVAGCGGRATEEILAWVHARAEQWHLPEEATTQALAQWGWSHPLTWRERFTDMAFVRVAGGSFLMGSPATETERYPDEDPPHPVELAGFWMGKYPVTVGQFRAFVTDTGHVTDAEREGYAFGLDEDARDWHEVEGQNWQSVGFEQGEDHPVVCVSWHDAQRFAQWLADRTDSRIRLPTEAEWEYACRAGTSGCWFWGEDPTLACRYANVACALKRRRLGWRHGFDCETDFLYTTPVGTFEQNGFGLHDMTGNVWEWCNDWYGEHYYAASPVCHPQGPPAGSRRVTRGGSWDDLPARVRSASRYCFSPGGRFGALGFRLVMASCHHP